MIRKCCSDWTANAGLKDALNSIGLLILRVGIGLAMMLGHGWGKLASFSDKADGWADPIGLGGPVSLALAIFAEFFCSLLLVLGFATRLAVVPLAVTMLVAIFIVHGQDPFARKELALLYLLPFIAILFAGPGRISLDHLLVGRLAEDLETEGK